MKTLSLIGILLLLPLFFAFDILQPERAQSVEDSTVSPTLKNPLEGTWKLVKFRTSEMADYQNYKGTNIKIFTKGYVYNVAFDGKQFAGAAGGKYSYSENSYTETPCYFTWDSQAINKSHSFHCEITEDQFRHFGKVEFEGNETYVDYVFQKMDLPENTTSLVGVWEATKLEHGQQMTVLADSNVKQIKVYTSTHFYVVSYKKDTGVFDHLSFGTYVLEDNKVKETIQASTRGKETINQSFDFVIDISKNQFMQIGMVNTPAYPNFKIVEQYQRIE